MLMITRRRALQDIIALSGLIAIPDCARNPVTRKRQLMLVSEDDEIKLGREAHPQIIQAYGQYKDKNLQDFMNRLGQNIVGISHRRNLKFTFTVLDNAVVNAFAVPGGYVYFNRGLMAYFNDEAQFAGVLGHEIGHVTARHSASQASKEQLAQLGLGLGTIFSDTFAQYSQFLALGASLMFLKFSRDDERQADKLGVDYSSALGYDAMRMSTFFTTFKRLSPQDGSALPEWESTHPDPGNRIRATEREAERIQKESPNKEYIVRRNDYLEMIGGLVYGDDPKDGYVRDGVFYHPDLKFLFPVPKNWRTANQPEDVRMYPDDQRVLLLFNIEPGQTPESAAMRFTTENEITVENYAPITVNGMEGFKLLGALNSSPTISLISYFIKMDNRVFAFHGLAAPFDLDSYDDLFNRTAMGFNRLTDPVRLNVPVNKVEVRLVRKAGTLKSAFNDLGVPEDKVKEYSILNGMESGDRVVPGFRVKVVA